VKGTSNMQLFYNATGQKVRKIVLQNGVTTTTDYLDGFQYKNTVLEFFGHAEGFVQNINNTLRYVYQYKDQVGNVRVSYASVNGVTTMLEENHYYPYGLKHAGYGLLPNTDNNSAFKYRYNSREYHDELGLDMTAMDFRLYDNVLGRFFGIDALSEKNHYLSPYQFGDGNPIVFADPTGLDSMPGWIRDLWDATPNGYNSTWTNIGGGYFQMTNFWGSGQTVNSIDAGPSGGGGSGGGGFLGDGYFGLPSFGVGTVYNYNTGAFTKPSGSSYYNFGNGLWTNTIMLEEVIVTGSLGKLNFPMQEIINIIETAQARFNGGGNGGGASFGMLDWMKTANTGIGAFGVGNGLKDQLFDYAVRTNYKSARTYSQFNNLRQTQKAWRYNHTLGKTGANYLKYSKGLGAAGAVLSTGYSVGNMVNYYNNGGQGSDVMIKTGLDVAMTIVGFMGPVGFGISATYFILDAATDGFGGFGSTN
jgi:RHS repeat-associated protein